MGSIMTPQEKCQQIADVLGIEVWMAMDEDGQWASYVWEPDISEAFGVWDANWRVEIQYSFNILWQDSLVHAEPRAT